MDVPVELNKADVCIQSHSRLSDPGKQAELGFENSKAWCLHCFPVTHVLHSVCEFSGPGDYEGRHCAMTFATAASQRGRFKHNCLQVDEKTEAKNAVLLLLQTPRGHGSAEPKSNPIFSSNASAVL